MAANDNRRSSSGYLVISETYCNSEEVCSTSGKSKAYPARQLQPQTQTSPYRKALKTVGKQATYAIMATALESAVGALEATAATTEVVSISAEAAAVAAEATAAGVEATAAAAEVTAASAELAGGLGDVIEGIGAVVGVGAAAIAFAPWLIGAAAVGAVGYGIYRIAKTETE